MPTPPDKPRFFIRRARAHGRCLSLLIALLILLAVHPFFGAGEARMGYMLGGLFTLVYAAAVYALSAKRRTLILAAILFVPAVFNRWFDPGDEVIYRVVEALAVFAFQLLVIVAVLGYVLRGRQMTDDRIYGAISAYIFIGLLFADGYELCNATLPDAFRGAGSLPDGAFNWADMLYFSFVTQTTLGYGDITPNAPAARSLAMMQAILGVLYLGVFIARLVSGSSDKANA